MDRRGIIAIQHHIATPVTHSDDEQLDLEIVGRLPLSENLQNAFWAFSYSIGDPCGRSFQLSMYFIGIPPNFSDSGLARLPATDKAALSYAGRISHSSR